MASEQQKTTYTAAEVAVLEETILNTPGGNRQFDRASPTP